MGNGFIQYKCDGAVQTCFDQVERNDGRQQHGNNFFHGCAQENGCQYQVHQYHSACHNQRAYDEGDGCCFSCFISAVDVAGNQYAAASCEDVQYVPADLFSAFFPVAMQTKAGQLVFTDLTAEGVEQVTGTVVEAAQYNLVLRLEDGTLRIFTKDQADMTRAGSLEPDSLVEVYYKSADPKTAIKLFAVDPATVKAPAAETSANTAAQEG